ncbi:hypothetical protein [Streptomyces cucumeris]|uniref:hypothetical protein n=1 Tax=Streptomyces cucumeris TaxID=2962890 RepID=UPI003EB84EF5
MKRALRTGAGIAVIVTAVAGCTSGDGAQEKPSAREKKCDRPMYRWLNVSQRPVVTDLHNASFTKGQQVSTRELDEVARYRVSVRADGPAVSAPAVLRSLERHVGTDLAYGAKKPGTATEDDPAVYASRRAEQTGSYVTARAVDLIEADFSYVCPDSASHGVGHTVTWQSAEEIIVTCEAAPKKGRDEAESEVARLGCRKGDPARV